MSDDSDKEKREQAKNLVNDLIKSIRQTLKEEEIENKLFEKVGKFVLLQVGAVDIDGRLTFVI